MSVEERVQRLEGRVDEIPRTYATQARATGLADKVAGQERRLVELEKNEALHAQTLATQSETLAALRESSAALATMVDQHGKTLARMMGIGVGLAFFWPALFTLLMFILKK